MARGDRWHYMDQNFWNGRRWVSRFRDFRQSHEMDALRLSQVHGVDKASGFPTLVNRCLFFDARARRWRQCEWFGTVGARHHRSEASGDFAPLPVVPAPAF